MITWQGMAARVYPGVALTDLEKLLEYVQASKKLEALRGHSVDHDTNLFHMGMAFAYQDVENMLIKKLRSLDNGGHEGNTHT